MTASATPNTLLKNFIKTWCPNIKRVGAGHLKLMRLFLKFKRDNISIELHEERFIPSSEMKCITRDYVEMRDVCFIMKGYSNHLQGKCDLIVGYTPQFDDLFIQLLHNTYKTQRQKEAHNNTTTPLLHYTGALAQDDGLDHIFTTCRPGSNIMNYTKTEKSERYYIWLQNLKREDKKELYAGCSDLDITSAFPNIFWQEICGLSSDNTEMSLMINDPEAFLNKCIDDDVFNKIYAYKGVTINDRDTAKRARSRLFHPPESGRPRKSGVKWYDDLQTYIISKLKTAGVTDAHLYFTSREQKIVNIAMKVIGEEHVVLRMHDGFIIDVSVNDEKLAQLQKLTGYCWKAKVL